MKVAWFRDTPLDAADPLDDTSALIAELSSTHAIDVVTEADAHDFVWRHARQPWDLCVYELDETRAHEFVWAYLLTYPGVALLKNPHVHHSWGGALSREGRLQDFLATFQLDDGARRPPPLQVPLYASRVVAVPYAALASELQDAYPGARIRFAPLGAGTVPSAIPRTRDGGALRVASTSERVAPLERAAARARAAGTEIELVTGVSATELLRDCDVVVDISWPPFEHTYTPALAAMAAGRALVILESDATADWPALDPQTWLPRDTIGKTQPVAVTVDPRDEEHSLMQALRRLAGDRALRERLGQAAQAWWRQHETAQHAATAWLPILEEAAKVAPPPRPAGWPAHLDADGTERARAILDEFGLSSDLLPGAGAQA